MKAVVLRSPQEVSKNPLQLIEVPMPELRPGFVLLHLDADLHIVEGELPQLQEDLIPGHQIAGAIVDGATIEFPIGTRVGVSWIGGIDGKCWYCQRGLENLRFSHLHGVYGQWRLC